MIRKLKIILEMIKFEHTLFALPFAYMGAIVASVTSNDSLPTWPQIGWITLAMVGARSAAMGLNRLIDASIDAKNPRTMLRAIPAGLISKKEVLLFIFISLLLLWFAASQLNETCVQWMPIAVLMLTAYSYTKRFTWLCHIFLGATIGLAPLGGWVAITGDLDIVAWVIYFAVVCWVAGFDILYACQDQAFDKKEGLYSIPAQFGIKTSLWIARSLHVATGLALIGLWWIAPLGWIYAIGIFIACLILIYEHTLLKPNDLTKLNMAFFTMNGILSLVIFAFTLMDVVV
jgi:4-hydroxybenzoate polyprenyltransferase